MSPFRRAIAASLPLAVLVIGGASSAPDQPAPAPKVTVRVVNYAEMGKVVRGLKGKVVVVDFWATTCPPCVAKFPHLVEMHNKYARDGLAAVSVSLDPVGDAEKRKKVESFLSRRKATFTNLLLDAPNTVWKDKLRFDGPPCVYVFDRANRIVGKYPTTPDGGVDYAVIEKQVIDLLKK
jgi:thiol-disulfide isomerase/thioredoxin